MRFMLLLKATEASEAGVPPTPELISAMGAFNEEMVNAGVLLAGEGLHPSARGARVHFSHGQRSVVHGPFPETGDLIAGFWLIQVASKDEAIAWAKRVPDPMGEGQAAEIEVRQVFEAADFPPDSFPPEEQAREEALRQRIATAAPRKSAAQPERR